MPKHYGLKADPVPYDTDPTLRSALRALAHRGWRWIVWRARCLLGFRVR